MFLRPTADVKQSVESAVLPDLMKNCKKRNLSAWTFKLSYIVLIFYLIYFLDPEIHIMQKTNIWVVTWPSSHGHCLTLSNLIVKRVNQLSSATNDAKTMFSHRSIYEKPWPIVAEQIHWIWHFLTDSKT